ncbi:MAG: hypothetical protein WA089_02980, partial [Anaerolineae bacterium]
MTFGALGDGGSWAAALALLTLLTLTGFSVMAAGAAAERRRRGEGEMRRGVDLPGLAGGTAAGAGAAGTDLGAAAV